VEFPNVEWHMIGHCQSRKAGLVAARFDMMHSLDSLKLAGKLSRALQEHQRTLPVLLEMNVSGEENKGGWEAWDEEQWERLIPEIEQILMLETLKIKGLMTMPPLFENPEAVRPYFIRLRRLRDWLAGKLPQISWEELSMGTSADFCVGIEEGATYVRIGTAILGSRSKG
jgi:pyridoxal phosphate enzyme (YggS family)